VIPGGDASKHEHYDADRDVVAAQASLKCRLRGSFLALTPYRIWASFTFVNSLVTITILAGLAMIVRAPFVFPSLGPTAFLFFFVPRSPAATPRHAIYGHAIGLSAGMPRSGRSVFSTNRPR
jgi:CBS-domain-containing membrane protein